MADVYEKDLAQKTSLNTSDYIRVVGSDNVSYKQLVSAVAKTIVDYELNSANSAQALASGDDLNDLKTAGTYRSSGSSVSAGVVNTPTTTAGYLLAVLQPSTAFTVQIAITANSPSVTYKRAYRVSNATWGAWEQQPTRAEVDALANKHKTIPVSGKTFSFNTSGQTNASWLVIGCSGTIAPFCFLVSTASGSVVINEIVDPYGLTWTGSLSGTTLTITCSASLTSNVKVVGL